MSIEQKIKLNVPRAFKPLWTEKARHKGAHGGRGGGKSHDRATAAIVEMLNGRNIVGLREIQRSIKDSVYSLVRSKTEELGVGAQFRTLRDEIICNCGSRMIFKGLQDHTAQSIKSLEGFDIAWVEEAQTISKRSIELLVPTIRKADSELWWVWNPEYDHNPVDELLRGENRVKASVVVEVNYWDNPYFPEDLRADMERDKEMDVELYEHIWCGGYRSVGELAFYGKELSEARIQGHICALPIERNPPIITAWDLGIVVTAIWVAQKIGHEVRVIDYYENSGEDAAHYARWVKENGYDTGAALLPHDADLRDRGAKTYIEHLAEAGLTNVTVLPRASSVLNDIQQVRIFIPKCWFDEKRTRKGLKALGAYHYEWDTRLGTPKQKPVGDWASHGADAFRYLALGFDTASHMGWNNDTSPNLIRPRRSQLTRANYGRAIN